MSKVLKIGVLFLFSIMLPSTFGYSGPKEVATRLYKGKKYSKAITLFHKYLRKRPKDYHAWSMLAAAYYHSGQPKVALKYFRRLMKYTARKSYNFYYQGLCLEELDRKLRAKQAYLLASKYSDEYSERSVFQIGIVEYHQGNKKYARYWANRYLERYPSGIFRKRALRMIYSLDKNKYISGLEGAKKPDMIKAMMNYHPLSIIRGFPHFWYLQGGFNYDTTSVFNPNFAQKQLVQEAYENYDLNGVAGFGVGPFKDRRSAAYLGYQYYQKWLSDRGRMMTWFGDLTDLEYFAFRPDLLERYHQIFGNFVRDFTPKFSFGMDGVYEIAKVGSRLPGPVEFEEVLPLSSTIFLHPWINYQFNPSYSIKGYLYLQKHLDQEVPAHSSRSYTVLEGGQDISAGVTQLYKVPELNLDLRFNLYRYSFVYNDYWLDNVKIGGYVEAEHEFIRDFHIKFLLGMYQTDFQQQIIKGGNCNIDDPKSVEQGSFKLCGRVDTAQLAQVTFEWDISRFQRLTGRINYSNNDNKTLKAFRSSRLAFIVGYAVAFPEVGSLEGFLQMFGDIGNTERMSR